MSDLTRKVAIRKGSERGFGLVFAAVFLIIGLYPVLASGPPRLWAFAIAGGFLAVALAAPRLLRPLNLAWFKLGLALGHVVAPLVMAVLFYLTVTPIGLLMRAFGKDPLRLKWDPAAKSYWIHRDDKTTPMQSMRNQY